MTAERVYIGKRLFEFLFINGIQLVTKVKSNMKNSLMSVADKIMLRKRALVESVNDELKNIAQMSIDDGLVKINLMSGFRCTILSKNLGI